MKGLIKEAVVLVVLVSVFAISVSASEFIYFSNCPSSATAGSSFNIEVTADDVDGVDRIMTNYLGTWSTPQYCSGQPTSCTKQFSYTAEGTLMHFSAAARDIYNNLIQDASVSCDVTIQGATDNPPTITDFSVTQSPTNPKDISIYIRATDDVDLYKVAYFIEENGAIGNSYCTGLSDIICQNTWTTTLSPGTYTLHAKAGDNTNPEVDYGSTRSITVTSANHAPIFTTSSLDTGVVNQPYSDNVVATDQDSDPLTYSPTATKPSWLTVYSSGAMSGIPTSAGIYYVQFDVFDTKVHVQSSTYPITVYTCQTGAIDTFYTGNPLTSQNYLPCHAGTKTCQSGSWVITIPEATPSLETCNNLDDNCDGQTDKGCEEGKNR
jgi:hypothetical protein